MGREKRRGGDQMIDTKWNKRESFITHPIIHTLTTKTRLVDDTTSLLNYSILIQKERPDHANIWLVLERPYKAGEPTFQDKSIVVDQSNVFS